MRLIRTSAAFVAVVLAAALPSLAAEPAAPATTEMTAAAPVQPLEAPWLLPQPVDTAAQKPGPCTVSVPCRFGPAVSCSGQVVCEWQYDSQWIRGYVYCASQTSSVRYYCPTGLDPGD